MGGFLIFDKVVKLVGGGSVINGAYWFKRYGDFAEWVDFSHWT